MLRRLMVKNMENKFKYDLFIGKNTPELRKKLEDMGYWMLPNGYMEWHIPMDELPYLTTDKRGFYKGTMANWNDGHKDCVTDEKKFLKLAKVKYDED